VPQGRSGQVWKFSSPTGIRFPDRPARSESLRKAYEILVRKLVGNKRGTR
jgi:hypothetical protein